MENYERNVSHKFSPALLRGFRILREVHDAAHHHIEDADNADRQLASMSVPVPLSGEPGECAMFDAERFERLLDRAAIAFRKVFDDGVKE